MPLRVLAPTARLDYLQIKIPLIYRLSLAKSAIDYAADKNWYGVKIVYILFWVYILSVQVFYSPLQENIFLNRF